MREQITSCRNEAVKEFVGEKDNLKFLYDPPAPAGGTPGAAGGSAPSMQSAEGAKSEDGGGCSSAATGAGAGGLILVGFAVIGLRQRRLRKALSALPPPPT